MSYDYDKLYASTPEALGLPTPAFVAFFEGLTGSGLQVLDIGCGQGRDALFIARLGHRVHGVDIAEHGIRDLLAAAHSESLAITGEVADIAHYTPRENVDILLIDRTLHMLPRAARLTVLRRLLGCVVAGGWCLIADEPSNIPDFAAILDADAHDWQPAQSAKGLLFARRV